MTEHCGHCELLHARVAELIHQVCEERAGWRTAERRAGYFNAALAEMKPTAD